MIEIKKGNIFTTNSQTIVNAVNTVGVMGAGIAYEFKLRYMDMFKKYQEFCKNGKINIGNLWIYKINNREYNERYEYILNFPTKENWRYPTKIEYLEKGLDKFINTYKQKAISSIAFPLLGASKGGLDEEISRKIMEKYLIQVDIPVEIWYFNPSAKDDLYEYFKEKFLELDDNIIKENSNLNINFIRKIKEILKYRDDINSLSGLVRVKGIGELTLKKSFDFIKNYKEKQPSLLVV